MFEYTKSQKEIQKAAREFAKGEFDREKAQEFEKTGSFPSEILQEAIDLGFIGIHLPEEFGGGGMGMIENVIVNETFCTFDPSIGSAIMQSTNGLELIAKYGTEEQKKNYLAPALKGHSLPAVAWFESEIGTDFTAIQTTAKSKEDGWLLNGKKQHVLNSNLAGFYIVLSRTQDEESPDDSLSLFLIEADNKEIHKSINDRRLGNNLVSSATITFENIEISSDQLIGKIGKGSFYLKDYTNYEYVNLAAQALGIAQASFESAMEYIKGREQFGRKIAEFQSIKHKIADMAMKIDLAKMAILDAANSCDRNKPDKKKSSLAKFIACRAAMEVSAQTIQIFGGYGYMTEYNIERFYREAKALEVRLGGWMDQKDMIADAVIGKIK